MWSLMRVGALGIAMVLFAGCGEAGPTASVEVDLDGTWELAEGSGPEGALSLSDGYAVTLSIEDGQVGGTSACNHYSAELSADIDSVRIQVVEGTAMGCEPEIMDLETMYLAALGDIDAVVRSGRSLTLTGPSTELRFTELQPIATEPTVGTPWVLESVIDGETASSTAEEPATLLLEEDGSFTASTGCRELTGAYVQEGGRLLITEMSADDAECADDLRAQDEHVVAVLGAEPQIAVDGGSLTLTPGGGLGLVYRAR